MYPVPEGTKFDLDTENFVSKTIPYCKECAKPVRPNICMWDDYDWNVDLTARGEAKLRDFLKEYSEGGITIIEIGAGSAVPTIRQASESVFCDVGVKRTFVRVNPEPGKNSIYGLDFDPINEDNIEQRDGPVKENEYFEVKMSAKPAAEMIHKAVQDLKKASMVSSKL